MAAMNPSGGAYTLLWSVVVMGMISPGNGTSGRIASNAFPYAELLSATMATAVGQSPVAERRKAASSSSAGMMFDIDAQQLDAALEAYGAATGESIIYDSKLTEGRRSRSVKGVYTPRAALDALLEGTSLMVRYTDKDSLVLIQAPGNDGNMIEQAGTLQRYRGLVQVKIEEAFCGDARLASGKRRVAFRFWIDRSGKVERAELLDSTGDQQFDYLVVDSLLSISIGEALPAGVVQPFTMLIMPRSSGHPWGCPEPTVGSSGYSPP